MNKYKLASYKATIDAAREEQDRRITGAVRSVFKMAGQEWAQQFPKRKLKLIAGMGSAFWTIDGEILHHDFENGYDSDYRIRYSEQCNGRLRLKHYTLSKRELFLPLLQAFEWLADVLDRNEYDSDYLIDMDFTN
jgi:hypothetical protein